MTKVGKTVPVDRARNPAYKMYCVFAILKMKGSWGKLVMLIFTSTGIGFDPQDKVYVALKQSDGFMGEAWIATLGPNIDLESVCS